MCMQHHKYQSPMKVIKRRFRDGITCLALVCPVSLACTLPFLHLVSEHCHPYFNEYRKYFPKMQRDVGPMMAVPKTSEAMYRDDSVQARHVQPGHAKTTQVTPSLHLFVFTMLFPCSNLIMQPPEILVSIMQTFTLPCQLQKTYSFALHVRQSCNIRTFRFAKTTC